MSGTESNRRRILETAGATVGLGLAGCLGGGESETAVADAADGFEGETLRVMVWSGNYGDRFEEEVKRLYEHETGVTLEVERGWGEVLERIREAPEDDPPYDVTITEGSFYLAGRNEGLFEPIRAENVPNLEDTMEFYREFRPTEYGVPVDGAPCTLIYREDLDFEPTSWSDMVSPPSDVGIGVDYGFWAFPLHAVAVGMDEADGANELYTGQGEMVLERLGEMDVTGWATSGEEIWDLFEAGEIDLAQFYFEQTHYDIDFQEGLSHVTPPDSPAFVNHWCVVRGTEKRDLAEHFLNFLLDADIQSQWAQLTPSLFTNRDVTYPSNLDEWLPTSSEEAAQFAFPDWEAFNEDWELYENAITEMAEGS
ncbi:ABC transporter substrate-binding protein [Halobiforma nitratireducens]|uniref:Spermidine/putrescine transporter substrate binding protein n=1 Tax=Halobiforma nitratireducens JCM 10879 TaxID=1227454 RepID=M0LTH7_9EURY|nr:extracellular solute-binding protein [Halobiforma nitratireducens]EMA36862.1 spermidine/putrescine transporter substrate binding protein [Halobiforma nitratireducens JCM 10879]